jgi:aspartyl-tRNA(Asn)/glutamyl-tRNA(Gln) amidotransferase subunit C
VDTTDVAPMTSVAAVDVAWRPDEVREGDRSKDILANAPARDDGYFVVPKAVE